MLDLRAVRGFIDTEIPGAGRLRAQLIAGGRSNLTYRIDDGTSTWVLRRPPTGGLTPSAHDMGREFRVVSALWGSSVPVARAVALCEDPAVLGVPFAVVEHVDGTVIRTRDDLGAFGDGDVIRCAYALVDVLAALHRVDARSVGLGDLGRPDGYLARQVRRWSDQWSRVSTRPSIDVARLHARLAEVCPTESGAAIVHGDFRIDNTILDRDDVGVVRAVVDWEMATLGDPLADLCLHLAYRDPAADPALGGAAASTSPRMPAIEDLLQRYATASGGDLPNLSFHLALAYFKLAVIAEGIHTRHLRGDTVGPGFDAAGDAVAPLAAAGLAALTGGC